MKKLALLLSLCIILGGCTQRTPYRTQPLLFETDVPPCVALEPSDCPKDAYFLIGDSGSDDGVPIGIIEFDDQGDLQDRALKDQVMGRIRELTQGRDSRGKRVQTLILVFAHGWLNNAAPDNQNLARFQGLLKRVVANDRALCEQRSCAGRKVVGVYLAWRGKSATVQPFKAMSFWNRKSRAHRIGQDGVTEVLAELRKMKAAGKSRLIVVGHSFGGAMIYSATQQLFMKDAASQDKPRKGKPVSVDRTIADLVILVNPAFEAGRFTPLQERAETMEFPVTQSPILAIFTSKTDTATKKAFPAGRRLANLFKRYNPLRPEQAKLDRVAVGHYRDYQTHQLCLNDEYVEPTTLGRDVCEWERFRKGEAPSWDPGRVILDRMQDDQPMNPYYNVVVDDAIISGHSGIWEPEYFMEFLARFVTVQEARECKKYEPDWKPKPAADVSRCSPVGQR